MPNSEKEIFECTIEIKGKVSYPSYKWVVKRNAERFQLSGTVCFKDETVLVNAQGEMNSIDQLIKTLKTEDTCSAYIEKFEVSNLCKIDEKRLINKFEIKEQ